MSPPRTPTTPWSATGGADAATEYCGGLADLSEWYGWATFLAGILILVLAPVLGQRADVAGNKKRWVVGATAVLALIQFALFFASADPAFFWFGAVAIALGAVTSEIAGVNYNAMLVEVSTPRTVGPRQRTRLGPRLHRRHPRARAGRRARPGRVVRPRHVGWARLSPHRRGLRRVDRRVRDSVRAERARGAGAHRPREDRLLRQLRPSRAETSSALFRNHRPTFWFLIASAVYRDGLAGVFAFGGVLAAVAFGFSATEVIIFGIALNLVAGVSTIIAGRLDDRFGARAVIVTALSILIVSCLFVFFFREQGKTIFWIGGIILSAAVGPAQASSRSLLARVTPLGMQGEIFGLYATTGRVMSFLSPLLWALFIGWFGATYWGIIGITIVLALGLFLLLLVKLPRHTRL